MLYPLFVQLFWSFGHDKCTYNYLFNSRIIHFRQVDFRYKLYCRYLMIWIFHVNVPFCWLPFDPGSCIIHTQYGVTFQTVVIRSGLPGDKTFTHPHSVHSNTDLKCNCDNLSLALSLFLINYHFVGFFSLGGGFLGIRKRARIGCISQRAETNHVHLIREKDTDYGAWIQATLNSL